MKINRLVVLLILMIVISSYVFISCLSYQDEGLDKTSVDSQKVIKGQTRGEFEQLIGKEEVLFYQKYAFFVDCNEKQVIVEFNDSSESGSKVECIYTDFVSREDITTESFENVEIGMSVVEVCEIVGLPFRSVTHGLATLDYMTCDNAVYRIQWDSQMRVLDISKLENID